MEEYAELSRMQQLFLYEYSQNFLKKTISCFKIGISPTKVTNWVNEDENFAACFNTIHELFADVLEGDDFEAARKSGQRRDKVLGNLNRKGYKTDPKGRLAPGTYYDQRSVIYLNGEKTEGFQGAEQAAKFLKDKEN